VADQEPNTARPPLVRARRIALIKSGIGAEAATAIWPASHTAGGAP